MITLYTPATGFPDLEAKIAYGLARIGIEAFKDKDIKIKPRIGFYEIEIDGDWEILKKSFTLICKRLLYSSFIPSNTPGITGRTANVFTLKEGESTPLDVYKSFPAVVSENRGSEVICCHQRKDVKKVSNVIGLTSATSYHHARDYINVQKDAYGIHRPTNPKKICKTCALLSLLGTWYATFMFSIKSREVFAIPLPREEINRLALIRLFSLHHVIRKDWINKDIPERVIPLVLLAKIPSATEVLEGFDLFISVISRQQGYHVDGLFLIPLENFLKYIAYSPYNVASIDIMLNRNSINSLLSLTDILLSKNLAETLKFSRSYYRETSTDNFVNLLYPETAKYLLEEVAMIKPEIIENEAISSVAKTLRYFIRNKKYHYADDIRNARKDSKDLEETIVKMLREGRLRFEQKEPIHLPNEAEIKELFQLANKNFDEVKTALVILAFSFPTKEEEIREEGG